MPTASVVVCSMHCIKTPHYELYVYEPQPNWVKLMLSTVPLTTQAVAAVLVGAMVAAVAVAEGRHAVPPPYPVAL